MSSTRKTPEHPGPAYNSPTAAAEAAVAAAERGGGGGGGGGGCARGRGCGGGGGATLAGAGRLRQRRSKLRPRRSSTGCSRGCRGCHGSPAAGAGHGGGGGGGAAAEAAEAAGVGGAVVGGAVTIPAGYGPHAGGFGLAPGSFKARRCRRAADHPKWVNPGIASPGSVMWTAAHAIGPEGAVGGRRPRRHRVCRRVL